MPGTTLPANLRLILALSLALCLHTLLLLGLPGPDHPPQPPQHPLNLTLLATGTPAPLPAAPASTPPGRRSSDMPTASRPDRRHTTSPHPATGQATDVPTPAAHPKPQPLQRPAVSGAARRTPQEATPPSPTQTVAQLDAAALRTHVVPRPTGAAYCRSHGSAAFARRSSAEGGPAYPPGVVSDGQWHPDSGPSHDIQRDRKYGQRRLSRGPGRPAPIRSRPGGKKEKEGKNASRWTWRSHPEAPTRGQGLIRPLPAWPQP